jgi:hypothetical protein
MSNNLHEIQGDRVVALTPELKKLVESGQISHSQAVKIMQEQGSAPKLLMEG